MVNKEEEKKKKEEETRKKYAKMSAMQLAMLRKRIKLMKAMPELVAMKNEHILNNDNYNKKIEYDKLRNMVAEKIPPYQMNKDNTKKVLNLLSDDTPRSRSSGNGI